MLSGPPAAPPRRAAATCRARRARAAAIRSRSSWTSRPAAKPLPGSDAEAAQSRIRSCATTASWWSPRMSCSCFATATKRAPRLAELVGGEIGRVARALDRDAGRVQRLVLGVVAERRERPAHPLRLAVEDLRQRRLVPGQRRRRRGLEPVEQREVAVAAERLDDVAVGGRALLLERLEQARRRLGVVAERRDLGPQPVEHDVEVARRAEVAAEPAELLAQRRRPTR